MKLRAFLPIVAATLMFPAAGRSEGIEGRWSVSLEGGLALEAGGDVHDGGSGTVLGLPTTVGARTFKDVYGTSSFQGQLAVGYGVSSNVELFGRGSYNKLKATQLQVGNVAGLALLGDFAEYKAWGAEAGIRYHLAPEARIKPYAALSAGVSFVSSLPATFNVPAASVTLRDVPFYDKSTVGVFGAGLGFSTDLAPNVAFGAEAGIRYQTKPKELNGLAGTGLENINQVGSRWSVPLLATLTFRF